MANYILGQYNHKINAEENWGCSQWEKYIYPTKAQNWDIYAKKKNY
jgi:hypothetical protein